MEIEKLPGAMLKHYEKNQVLIHQGEPVTHLYYLIKGTIHREVVTLEGYENIPSVKTAASKGVSSLVGVLALFTGNDDLSSNSTFITRTACTCYKIPQSSVMDYLKQNPEELIEVVHLAMKEHANLFQLLIMRNEGQVANRLCKILEERSGEATVGCAIGGHNTNVELAKFLGVHKVTIARIIRQLKEDGTIRKQGNQIYILAPEILHEYAECRRQLKYF